MAKTKVIVLGCGLVGSVIAKDLAKDYNLEVTVADINTKSLNNLKTEKNIKKIKGNLKDFNFLSKILNKTNLVVNAVPGFMGFKTLESIIETGKSVVDISFFPEDIYKLDELAKNKNVSVFFDCGVAPGMSNMLVARGYSLLDETDSAEIYVGGLPITRELPYEYKAGFSPIDVIEEYTRPVYNVEKGLILKKEALSELEHLFFDNIGTLEAFNTDGLRSLIRNINIPNMKEKTLRYPGHVEKIKLLKATGFFDNNEIEINGIKIKPIDIASKLLFPMWELKKGEPDLTVMKIIVKGKKSNKPKTYECNLYDEYDNITKIHSMARSTGYTATTIIRLYNNGDLSDLTGIVAPETIGLNENIMKKVFKKLKDKGLFYKENLC